jgi:O-acetyl-ADP-ribose deacetylase (regulator of RNase III)
VIEFLRGDIFEVRQAEALVNPTNCVGVMGRGVALAMKNRFPWCFGPYRQACAAGTHRPGTILWVPNPGEGWPRGIVHLPTKRHWRQPSVIGDVRSGVEALVTWADHEAIRSVAVPALGCGLGGLEWDQVRSLMGLAFAPSPCRFLVLEP